MSSFLFWVGIYIMGDAIVSLIWGTDHNCQKCSNNSNIGQILRWVRFLVGLMLIFFNVNFESK